MHLVQISFHFEFWEKIEAVLDECQVEHFVRYPTVQGKDVEGKHYGGQVFPGSVSVVQVQAGDGTIDKLFEALERFRDEREAHRHLTVVALRVSRRL
jgi:hypothetical protein